MACKTEIAFRNFLPRQLLALWDFPSLYFDLLIDKFESEHATQTCQALKQLKAVKARQHKRHNKIMNSENAPKEIVKSFIDLANMTKGFINENLSPSVTQELGRLFPSTGGGRRGQSRELRVGAGELSVSATDATGNTSFTTHTTKRTIE